MDDENIMMQGMIPRKTHHRQEQQTLQLNFGNCIELQQSFCSRKIQDTLIDTNQHEDDQHSLLVIFSSFLSDIGLKNEAKCTVETGIKVRGQKSM